MSFHKVDVLERFFPSHKDVVYGDDVVFFSYYLYSQLSRSSLVASCFGTIKSRVICIAVILLNSLSLSLSLSLTKVTLRVTQVTASTQALLLKVCNIISSKDSDFNTLFLFELCPIIPRFAS